MIENTQANGPLSESQSLPRGVHTEPAPPTVPGYRIVSRRGSGGMGTVWRAVQSGTNREVALKLSSVDNLNELRRLRFELEIQTTARLEHPNIARVYEARVDGQQCCYAMELVDGERLDRYCMERRLERPERLALFAKVCRAVEHAHLRGVVHRDLKPSNIMVSTSGEPKVLDFGLAKQLDDDWLEPGEQRLADAPRETYDGAPTRPQPTTPRVGGRRPVDLARPCSRRCRPPR